MRVDNRASHFTLHRQTKSIPATEIPGRIFTATPCFLCVSCALRALAAIGTSTCSEKRAKRPTS